MCGERGLRNRLANILKPLASVSASSPVVAHGYVAVRRRPAYVVLGACAAPIPARCRRADAPRSQWIRRPGCHRLHTFRRELESSGEHPGGGLALERAPLGARAPRLRRGQGAGRSLRRCRSCRSPADLVFAADLVLAADLVPLRAGPRAQRVRTRAQRVKACRTCSTRGCWRTAGRLDGTRPPPRPR